MTVVLRSGSQSSLGSTVLEQGLPASKTKKLPCWRPRVRGVAGSAGSARLSEAPWGSFQAGCALPAAFFIIVSAPRSQWWPRFALGLRDPRCLSEGRTAGELYCRTDRQEKQFITEYCTELKLIYYGS